MALGHEVKLMPAQNVKTYVKRGESDVVDAEAICEAVTRPTMRFVGVKTPEQTEYHDAASGVVDPCAPAAVLKVWRFF
jgi:transposase